MNDTDAPLAPPASWQMFVDVASIASDTGNADVAEANTIYGVPPATAFTGAVESKWIDWLAGLTVTDCCTVGAAR